ncbi:Aste57867_12482 [Aphanomyces stellatus]|uniref:Dolichyl-diphosphooligosaccharide--protein glycosyltransferase subunit 1 n=1 Tax=Aphanomyces stellatus TaxID=120398 RepID=A0A485KWA7_9STRA|nr:hypothetical protein As57867_012436 [Aphanomyces stellatus]VFT89333.1 Aste57867_12482 [Aphanomyces stellatus]
MSAAAIVLSALLVFACLCAEGIIINTSVKRTIDLSQHIVRCIADISFQDADADVSTYTVAVPLYLNERLAFISAKGNKGAPYDVVAGAVDTNANVQFYSVVLKAARGTEGSVKVSTTYTRVLTPYPASIKQSEDQLVLFHDQHLFVSPYATLAQTTRVKLPSSHVESHSDWAPVSLHGSTLTYGPYDSVVAPLAALAHPQSLAVHFQHNEPFLTITSLVKEIEVSMWGRISTEEVIDMEHTGATLRGGFSRLDYASNHLTSASFRSFRAHLPKHAANIYYRDQIGNITTSHVTAADARTDVELLARFPLFGGWKTQFYLGYAVPTHAALVRQGDDRYRLEMDFGTCIQEAAVDAATLKVILPEGATNIRVHMPFEVSSIQHTRRLTYLDASDVGRPVVVVRKLNVVPQHNNLPVSVTFEFPATYLYREPALLVGSFFAFFLVCMVLFRVDLSLSDTKPKVE